MSSSLAALDPVSYDYDEDSGSLGSSQSFTTFFSPGLSGCVIGGPVYLTNVVAVLTNSQTTVTFQIAGGFRNVLYDILTTTELAPGGDPASTIWTPLGEGYTCSTYTFSNQPATYAYYTVRCISSVVAWGDNTSGQCNVPLDLSNVVQVAGGDGFSVALKSDGTVRAWGDNSQGQTNVPAGLSNVVAVAAGQFHCLALCADGTVTNWGKWRYQVANIFANVTMPSGLSNVAAISAGNDHDVAILASGLPVAWGYTNDVRDALPSGSPTNMLCVSAAWDANIAILANNSVFAWGIGFLSSGGNLTNVPADLTNAIAIAAGGFHNLAVRSDSTVSAWGQNDLGEANVPSGLSNVVDVAAGEFSSLALKNDGSLSPWGYFNPTTAAYVPPALTNHVSGIASGMTHFLAIRSGPLPPLPMLHPISQTNSPGGSVTFTAGGTGIGPINYQWLFNGSVIEGATDSTLTLPDLQPAQQGNYSLVINNGYGSVTSSNAVLTLTGSLPAIPGTIWLWGGNEYGQGAPSTSLSNLMAIAAGDDHVVAVHEDGTVTAWGSDDLSQTNVPTGLSNVVSVAAGAYHSLALKADGMVVGWGDDVYGQASAPSGLSNVVAISAYLDQSMALESNGTVVTWGDTYGTVPTNLVNPIAIAAGDGFELALQSDGAVRAWGETNFGIAVSNVISMSTNFSDVVAIAAGGHHALALKRDGTVAVWGDNTYNQTNMPPGLNNVIAIAAGANHSLALKNDGTVVAWGDNSSGQTNTLAGLTNVHAISAAGSYSAALTFTPRVQYYPLDIAKDLLLIYNTNSVDSSNVMTYYLNNRPMVSNANVLGISYAGVTVTNATVFTTNSFYVTNATTYESISPVDFTNKILAPVTNWLSTNQTKRPAYIILFLDVPSRVSGCVTNTNYFPFYCADALPTVYVYPSVNYQLSTAVAGWHPFITSINMDGPADCKGYIDKLKSFASNSPNKLNISASAGAYGNTTYCLDDSGLSGDSGIIAAIATLTNEGVALTNIYYGSFTNTTPITMATNVTAYWTKGTHGPFSSHYAFPTDGSITFSGTSGWYIMTDQESFSGQRYVDVTQGASQSSFLMWHAATAFGGTQYSNTPVGSVSHVDEPVVLVNSATFYGLWAAGNSFAITAWNSRQAANDLETKAFQAVGDPFVKK